MGYHFLLQGIFPTQGGIELGSPALQADSLPAEPPLILFNSGNWLLYCIGELLNVILGCLLFPHNSLQIISFSKNTTDVMLCLFGSLTKVAGNHLDLDFCVCDKIYVMSNLPF